ncbi:MAG: hypothetical protein EOO11_01255 [Chitinophagaceae bacterium]|nr:MAG: hypothetical protein EOO11_01255 [Chitinophagaceae bacterium]
MLFLSRVAFVCNVFFLLALLVKMGLPLGPPEVLSTIVIIGYVLVAVLSPVLILGYGVLLLRRRLFARMPRWLVVANFIFFLLQLQYLLFLNGKLPA